MTFPPEGYSQEAATDGVRAWTQDGRIARIAMARPERRNAQDASMLYGLDTALAAAMAADTVRVVVLSGDGPHFCAGHGLDDLDAVPPADRAVTASGGYRAPGAAGRMAVEEEMYLGLHRRWRDLPKPLIAMVHGHAVAGGLMTAWVCDLIVASEDARFSDPVIAMGMNAHEWFVHPWEFGARKAKELLFTGATCTAAEALRMGMVNHVVDRERLESFTLSLARRIADQDPFALKLAKQCVNHALDAQGQREAVDHAFALHQLAHAHHQAVDGTPVSRAWLEARRGGAA
ncbi:enoyl-CoA hydratase [Actinomadura sp. 3N407]|uniref:enoyl-CoA hydratase n=1 Tax=Actinomadura sp. 3N407 TaxID=3457423 RepID=UPI003FCC3E37